MIILCAKDMLINAVSSALCVISSKNTIQALDGFLITADKDSGILIIYGYDLEKGIKVTLSGDGVQIKESGKIILNAFKFSSIIRNLPGETVSIVADDNFTTTISNQRSIFKLRGLGSEAYPLIPEPKSEKSIKINREVMKNMINATLFAIDNNNSRPSLNGALFSIRENGLTVVASDNNRLAISRNSDGVNSNIDTSGNLDFIVPKKSLAELLKLIDNGEDLVQIELTKKHMIMAVDNIVYFSRLIESEFLDYRRILKTMPKSTVIINTKNFINSVERASIVNEDKQRTPVKLVLNFKKQNGHNLNKRGQGILQITYASSIGEASDECDIEMCGDDLVIGFNHRYLLECLKAIREETIMLKLESPIKSLIMMPYDKERDIDGQTDESNMEKLKFMYIIMPSRILK